MNPFLEEWPLLDRHSSNAKCTTLASSDYVDLSNEPDLPQVSRLRGRVVIIAGKPRTGGKSVLSHKLLHECEKNNIIPIDLAASRELNRAHKGDLFWFKKTVSKAHHANLFAEDAKRRILSEDDWEEINLQLRRELKEDSLAIRMPKLDGTLSVGTIARNIEYYARSAEFLGDSIYLYEYRYVYPYDWLEVREWLDHSETGNILVIEAPLLLVDDAMTFVCRRLAHHELGEEAVNCDELRKFLEDKEIPGTHGLEISIGDLSDVMYRAFERCEEDRSLRFVDRYIVEQYTTSVIYRDLALRRSQNPDE
jgi:hypothetical protein